MQLVAYGAQDIYLTGNPQITFFKLVYRRHTNFSMESIKQTFDGNANFGGNVTATISRNGDLVHRMYLEHDSVFTNNVTTETNSTSAQINLVERYGDSLIRDCEIEIGGQRIDRHTSMWNRVWSDLTEFNPSGYNNGEVEHTNLANQIPLMNTTNTLGNLMKGNNLGLNTGFHDAINEHGIFSGLSNQGPSVGTINGFTYTAGIGDDNTGTIRIGDDHQNCSIDIGRIFIPLNFWFCRNPGLALPLIALQYHEVKVKINFEELRNLCNIRLPVSAADFSGIISYTNPVSATTETVNISNNRFDLYCDYIYLDTDERRRFAQVSHEYLIDQVQIINTEINNANPNIELNFNHPVKELIWCMRNETPTNGRNAQLNTGSGDSTAGPVSLDTFGGEWLLKLNGHDRFKRRDTKYFTRTQIWQHHTGYGALPTYGASADSNVGNATENAYLTGNDSIAVYSFALKPEEHQPSGTCNFSRIDNAELIGRDTTVSIINNGQSLIGGTDNIALTVFAVNYNVLRIMSGMGGLAYSN